MGLKTTGGRIACALSIGLSSVTASASVILIDTLPRPLDPTTTYSGFGLVRGHQDYAAGFEVVGPGTITRITATMYVAGSPGTVSIGIATNAMIGHPSPVRGATPPGSFWEREVCSTVPFRPPLPSGCDGLRDLLPVGRLIEVGAGEAVDIAVTIPLPSAGIYWFYESFGFFGASAWIANQAAPTTLFAEQSCGPFDCTLESGRTFVRATGPTAAPGLRIEFEPAAIPEPPLIALVILGGLALWAGPRRAKQRKTAAMTSCRFCSAPQRHHGPC